MRITDVEQVQELVQQACTEKTYEKLCATMVAELTDGVRYGAMLTDEVQCYRIDDNKILDVPTLSFVVLDKEGKGVDIALTFGFVVEGERYVDVFKVMQYLKH